MRLFYRDLEPAVLHPVSGDIVTGEEHAELYMRMHIECSARQAEAAKMGYLHKPTGRFIDIAETPYDMCSSSLEEEPDDWIDMPKWDLHSA